MDVPAEPTPGPSVDAQGKEASLSSAGTRASVSPGASGDSRCRKSSRLKERMNKQADDSASVDAGDTYNLRLSSLVKRAQVERRQAAPKQPKGKSKPPPLSKYRRRTANARERMRMQEINEAFERLRQSLPEMEEQQSQDKKKEKPTKLTVLSLALNYIHALRDILGYSSVDTNSSGGGATASSSEESDLGSDGTSLCTVSTPSVSCDDTCSTSSPEPSTSADLKDICTLEPRFVSAAISKSFSRCHDPLPGSSAMMDFRGEARSSPSSSDPSLSPSPPPLPLPEECMDLDQSDLLGVSMSLAALDGIDDIDL